MSENKSNLLSGLKNFFIEEEPESNPSIPVVTQTTQESTAAPSVVLRTAGQPMVVDPKDDSQSFTEAELKSAESTVAGWSNFKAKENLKKFASIEAKLKGKIIDPVALRVASFEMAEVAGIEQNAIINEAKDAVNMVITNLSEADAQAKTKLVLLDQNETAERKSLESEIASLEANLVNLKTRLSNLSSDKESAKKTLQKQFGLLQSIAKLFVETWSPLTESKK